jgi:hypothetical protein
VNGAQVHALTEGKLSLLWSKAEWPFDPAFMQRSATEFHSVVNRIFDQAAVVPFRLLTVFEDEQSLTAFAAQHQEGFLADLDRLRAFVQMEYVAYFLMPRPGDGEAHVQRIDELWRTVSEHVQKTNHALSGISNDIQVRRIKCGSRVFVLLERGREAAFQSAVRDVIVPQGIARRVKGPRPAVEFLGELRKAPQIAGVT